jgi:hypothetical protein
MEGAIETKIDIEVKNPPNPLLLCSTIILFKKIILQELQPSR